MLHRNALHAINSVHRRELFLIKGKVLLHSSRGRQYLFVKRSPWGRRGKHHNNDRCSLLHFLILYGGHFSIFRYSMFLGQEQHRLSRERGQGEHFFLPAAKPSGHRTVRVVVVVVVVGGGGDYFEVMTLELTLSQGQLFLVEVTFIFFLHPVLPP